MGNGRNGKDPVISDTRRNSEEKKEYMFPN